MTMWARISYLPMFVGVAPKAEPEPEPKPKRAWHGAEPHAAVSTSSSSMYVGSRACLASWRSVSDKDCASVLEPIQDTQNSGLEKHDHAHPTNASPTSNHLGEVHASRP